MLPDYRTQRSATPEGSGRARAAWEQYHLRDNPGLAEQAGATSRAAPTGIPDDVLDDIRDQILEETDLLGFWIAWHRAGGFAGLEAAGWNRATIFRRLRRFRSAYDTHPDDYQPDWITLDLPTVWAQSLHRRIQGSRDEP